MIGSIRRSARHIILNGFAALDAMRSREQQIASSRLVQVVNFHHLYDYEKEPFREFLTWFGQHYFVVPYSEAVDRVRRGEIDAAYGAITFDDGLKSVVNAGQVLDEFGYSATFFVCPGIIGETRPEILRSFCERARMVYESDEFLSWEDLESLKDRGHEIGSHTVTHPWIESLTADQMDEELRSSKEMLTAKLGAIEHFAWPFGTYQSLGSIAAKKLVEGEFGYTSVGSGVRGSHGCYTYDSSKLPMVCMRRDNVEARWPLGHIKHFLIRNATRPVDHKQWWPDDWDISV